MGTLFDQKPREDWNMHVLNPEDMLHHISVLKKISKLLTTDECVSIIKLAMADRAYLYNQRSDDARDEQIAGFGELLRSLIDARYEQFGELRSSIVEFGEALIGALNKRD